MALVDLEVFEHAAAERSDDAPAIDHERIVLRMLPGGDDRAAAARRRKTSRELGRVRQLLWLHVLAILHAEEPVLVYGPKGKAKLVPRRLAEQMAGARQLRRATSIEDARTKLGLPTVGFVDDPTASFDGIDRGVLPGATAADRAPLATWTCEVCKDVHPADHAGMMLFACGGMLCCGCEPRWAEHQGACVPCAELAATLTEATSSGAPLFDLSDTPEE